MSYIFNDSIELVFEGANHTLYISNSTFQKALELTNKKIEEVKKAVPTLFGILGMRNLSAFVGEVFVESMCLVDSSLFIKNPHQDGYPDILIMTEEGKSHWESLSMSLKDKGPFSNFQTGGIEVKATCGTVPTSKALMKKGLNKPEIGDQRIELMKGYDWKAHHRETNNLIGLVRDFVENTPMVVGVFYSGNIEESDRGKIIHPKEGGGRTTSVSIMTRLGISKMYLGRVAVYNNKKYIEFFDRYNKDILIQNYITSLGY